jgi:predicted metal-dependent RNase
MAGVSILKTFVFPWKNVNFCWGGNLHHHGSLCPVFFNPQWVEVALKLHHPAGLVKGKFQGVKKIMQQTRWGIRMRASPILGGRLS